MNKLILSTVAATAFVGGAAFAQEASNSLYGGGNIPSLFTVGYARSFNSNLAARAEYAFGMNYNRTDTYDGVNGALSLKSSVAGVYADLHPFSGGFRLVAGVAVADIKADLRATGSGTATINGKSVNMSGQFYNVNIKMPSTMPYLGLGYGHYGNTKGLGFFFDFGYLIGKPEVKSTTSLVGVGGITQADIDAQDATLRDSVGGLGAFPVFQAGVTYRF